MQQYPYSTPQVLTDTIFVQHGGSIGTSTSQMRTIAYVLAEEQMTEHLSSFLVPTVITGSARPVRGNSLWTVEFGHVNSISHVELVTITNTSPLTTKTYTGSALIHDDRYGYIDIFAPGMCGSQCGSYLVVHSVGVVYNSGLQTGTSNQPAMLTALTMAAQINLNEMDVSLSNESTADIGVQEYSNQSYTESRVRLGASVFGNSAISQRAARLVKKYRSKPAIGFN